MEWKTQIYRPLETEGYISPAVRQRLQALDIPTVEDLLALSAVSKLRQPLARSLQLTENQLERLLQNAKASHDPALDYLLQPLPKAILDRMPLGCELPTRQELRDSGAELSEQPEFPFELSRLKAGEVNHIPRMQPIRSQGSRGTCVAFGTTAVREFLIGQRPRLSEQFLYWGCKQRDNRRDKSGTWIRYAMACLEQDGICTNDFWPYNPQKGNTEHQGPPPAGWQRAAAEFRVTATIPLDPNSVNELRRMLSAGGTGDGCPISFAIPVFKSWYQNPGTHRTGKIPMPLTDEPFISGHCMTLVGYRDDAGWPGGGYFIFRNSWGPRWAAECPFGAGYGTLPYKFMALHGKEAWAARAGGRAAHNRKDRGGGTGGRWTVQTGTMGRADDSRQSRPARKTGFLTAIAVALLAAIAAFWWAGVRAPDKTRDGIQAARLVSQGERAFATGRFDEAARLFDRANDQAPPSVHTLLMEGRAWYAGGNLKEALSCYEDALALAETAGRSAGIHYELGILLIEMGRPQKARSHLRRAADLNPELVSAATLADMTRDRQR